MNGDKLICASDAFLFVLKGVTSRNVGVTSRELEKLLAHRDSSNR